MNFVLRISPWLLACTDSRDRPLRQFHTIMIFMEPTQTMISLISVTSDSYSNTFTSQLFFFPPQVINETDFIRMYLGWEFSSYILSLASLKRLMVCFVLLVRFSMTTRKYSFSPRISILPSYRDRTVRRCW